MRRPLPSILSIVYLNALFSFENIPSTPALRLVPRIAIEVALLVFLLAIMCALGWELSKRWRVFLGTLLFIATLIRYVEVTALGVLGREFNLHGDFPHVHRVFAMFWEALSLSRGLMVLAVVGAVCLAAILANAVALRTLYRGLRELPRLRRGVIILVPVCILGFLLWPSSGAYSTPVSAIVAKQIRNVSEGEAEALALVDMDWSEGPMASDLEGLGGANVFLVFLESYGVTLIEDAHHFDSIEPRFRSMERRLAEAGYVVRSSQIQSPTFGGGSWRAHATLLSGIQVESEHVYNALLASERQTLVDVLKHEGYRTVAAEPGIKWYWPDGAFYGFDKIYDFETLAYHGPPMGWWKIPDQFTLYRIYTDEIRNAEKPLFAKFSLIMSHIPYYPVPEYVGDWERFDDQTAYSEALGSVAHDAYRDLSELSTWYVKAFEYELDILEGFLLSYVPDNSLIIIVGDHQPPKLVTHDNDSWAVPMHVLSKRRELVEPFEALGFRPGLVPLDPSALRMADFLESFLCLFDRSRSATMPACH